MAQGYVCSLPNPGTPGAPRELFYSDDEAGRARAEQFAQGENRPGRGVYDCIGKLQDGARTRSKATVAELDKLVADIDLKNIVEPRTQVIKTLQELLLPPTEIRDSGFGLHADWALKEGMSDQAGLEQAEHIMARLVELLAADPAPTHRAALLRRPGSDNTKDGTPRKCHVIGQSGAQYDITEFEDMFDVYGDRPLLSRKEQPKRNGHDKAPSDGPVDAEAELSSICDGGSANAAQCKIIPSLLRKGEHPKEVLEYVANNTVAAANKHRLGWAFEREVACVRRRILSAYNNLLLKDYDPGTGVIPDWLPGEFHQAWINRVQRGDKPNFGYRRDGFYIRSARRHADDRSADKESDRTRGNDTKTSEGGSGGGGDSHNSKAGAGPGPKASRRRNAGPLIIRPFVPFDPASLPPRPWLYGRHYMRRTVSATVAPGGYGKSTLNMVEAIAMATARNLLGEQPTQRLRVWLHNGEDPLDEMKRRIAAICIHYGIPQEELVGWFFLTTSTEFPLRVASDYDKLEINDALVARIGQQIQENAIDVSSLDPLITLHGVREADNNRMDEVIRIFAGIADDTDSAIELSHHMRKPAPGSNGDYGAADIRGATAIHDAVRAARILNRMCEKDALELRVEDHERAKFFRVDRAKGNYSPAAKALWRQFINIQLPNGDDVGVVAPWDYPGQGAMTPERQKREQEADFVFLQLVNRFALEGRILSEKPNSQNYAPRVLADEPEAKAAKLNKIVLKGAMVRLFKDRKIKAVDEGSGGRSVHKIVPAN